MAPTTGQAPRIPGGPGAAKMMVMPRNSTPPGRRLLEPEVARVAGVLPVWLDPMVEHLQFPPPVPARPQAREWDLNAVDGWLRRSEHPRPAPVIAEPVLRWLVLRLIAHQPATLIGKRDAVPRAQVERQSLRLAIRLISQIPYEVQKQWDRDHQTGSTDKEIAARAQVGVTLVRLVLRGIPPPVPGGRINPYLLHQLWNQGLPIPVIAQQVGRSVARTRAEIDQADDSLPTRLTVQQVANRFGWARTNVRGLRQHPHFPKPDGHPAGATTGRGIWWWAATIDQWEAGVTLTRCRVCGARVQRLGTHRAAKHPQGSGLRNNRG